MLNINVNAEKELNNDRAKSLKSSEKMDQITELKLLLENNAVEERNILKEAGLDFNLQVIEKERGINLERKKLETQMESVLFTYEEIKRLCIKYDLRFARSRDYNGVIEPVLGASIINFFKSKKIDGMNHAAANDLFIIAPAKAFNKELKEKPRKNMDPILLYKVKNSSGMDMYALVHKWGNDFSILRRIRGWMYERPLNLMLFHGSLKATVIFALFSLNRVSLGWSLFWSLSIPSMMQTIHYFVMNDGTITERKYQSKFTREKFDWTKRKSN